MRSAPLCVVRKNRNNRSGGSRWNTLGESIERVIIRLKNCRRYYTPLSRN